MTRFDGWMLRCDGTRRGQCVSRKCQIGHRASVWVMDAISCIHGYTYITYIRYIFETFTLDNVQPTAYNVQCTPHDASQTPDISLNWFLGYFFSFPSALIGTGRGMRAPTHPTYLSQYST